MVVFFVVVFLSFFFVVVFLLIFFFSGQAGLVCLCVCGFCGVRSLGCLFAYVFLGGWGGGGVKLVFFVVRSCEAACREREKGLLQALEKEMGGGVLVASTNPTQRPNLLRCPLLGPRASGLAPATKIGQLHKYVAIFRPRRVLREISITTGKYVLMLSRRIQQMEGYICGLGVLPPREHEAQNSDPKALDQGGALETCGLRLC